MEKLKPLKIKVVQNEKKSKNKQKKSEKIEKNEPKKIESKGLKFNFSVSSIHPITSNPNPQTLHFMVCTSLGKLYHSSHSYSEKGNTEFQECTDFGISLPNYEKIRSIDFTEVGSGLGCIFTTHHLYFFNPRFIILKKTSTRKMLLTKKMGFCGSLYIFEDSRGIYADSPSIKGTPRLLCLKSNPKEEVFGLCADRMMSSYIDNQNCLEIRTKKFDMIDLAVTDFFSLKDMDSSYLYREDHGFSGPPPQNSVISENKERILLKYRE